MRLLALILGILGLVPFVAGAAASWLGALTWHAPIVHALVVYSALIISFLGGVHWGVAFSQPSNAQRHLLWGVAVVILAWGAVLLPWAIVSLSVFVLLLLLSWHIDRSWLAQVGVALKYAATRTLLTAIAALSLLITIGSYGRAGIL